MSSNRCETKAGKSTISLFSLIFRALLLMKLSSSESESCTSGWGRGSDAGLFLFVFLEGNVIETFRAFGLRPRLGVSVFTFWKIKTYICRERVCFNVNMLNRSRYILYHGFHLTADLTLKPAARVLLWRRFKHFRFSHRPPPLTQDALLKTATCVRCNNRI